MHPKDDTTPQTTEPNEGEGSRTAARRYNEATRKYVESGRAEEAAKRAKEALEGDEAEALAEAEEEGRAQASGVELDKEFPENDADVDEDVQEDFED